MAAADSPVSVVIPTYNYAHYLREAVDSVLSQTYPAVELIVVNDGSTDNTREILDSYGDRILAVHQENQGLSAARNTGIRKASHDFVAFLDADDVWEPDKLACQMARFADLPPEYGLVACDRGVIYRDGQRHPEEIAFRKTKQTDGEITAVDLLTRSRFSPSSVVARRACFDNCGLFDTSLRSTEDRDMWIRIAERWRLFWDSRVLCFIRKHGENMSANAPRMKRNMLKVLHAARVRNRDRIRTPLFWRRVFAFLHFQVAWMHYESGHRGKAISELLLSWLHSPWMGNPAELDEVFLFRLRSLRLFLTKLPR
jgi:glycosyltransferase involved in cell wall biosynthesis